MSIKAMAAIAKRADHVMRIGDGLPYRTGKGKCFGIVLRHLDGAIKLPYGHRNDWRIGHPWGRLIETIALTADIFHFHNGHDIGAYPALPDDSMRERDACLDLIATTERYVWYCPGTSIAQGRPSLVDRDIALVILGDVARAAGFPLKADDIEDDRMWSGRRRERAGMVKDAPTRAAIYGEPEPDEIKYSEPESDDVPAMRCATDGCDAPSTCMGLDDQRACAEHCGAHPAGPSGVVSPSDTEAEEAPQG